MGEEVRTDNRKSSKKRKYIAWVTGAGEFFLNAGDMGGSSGYLMCITQKVSPGGNYSVRKWQQFHSEFDLNPISGYCGTKG